MRITIKLGSTLRSKAADLDGGEGELELRGSGPWRVVDAMEALDIAANEVNLIYLNHRLVTPATLLHEGDRLALFPPNFIHFSQFYLKREGS
jgi:molybdopterin converting factor small subunit